MAKGKSESQEPSNATSINDTMTFSTRFTPEQRELIGKAAESLGWSPARFIRQASILRAAEVVNSVQSSHLLRGLALELAKHLLNPRTECVLYEGHESDRKKVISYEDGQDTSPQPPSDDGWPDNPRVVPLRPSESDLRQIYVAFESCGTEFAKMVLEAWAKVNSNDTVFSPVVNVADFLKNDDKEVKS